MAVVLLDHARVAVPERCCDKKERHTRLDEMRGIGVSKSMEGRYRHDLAARACRAHCPHNSHRIPGRAVRPRKQRFGLRLPRGEVLKEPHAIVCERHTARLAAFAVGDEDRVGMGIKVTSTQGQQFTPPSPHPISIARIA